MGPAAYNTPTTPSHQARRPVFSPQFGQVYATTAARPFDGNDDDANTDQTAEWMREAAAADSTAPVIVRATIEAIGDETRQAEKARLIFAWIKSRLTFQEDNITAALAGLPDPEGAEVLIRPVDILAMPRPAGDCDDYTMLAVAMLTAAGVPARITAIEQDQARPGYFSHVYAEAFIDGRWTPFDASHGEHVGWYARATGKVKSWATGQGKAQMQNLNGWEDWVSQGINITGKILVPRLGVPQTPGGFYQGPGVTAGNNPTGSAITFPGASINTIGSGGNNMLLFGAAAILGIVVISKIAKG